MSPARTIFLLYFRAHDSDGNQSDNLTNVPSTSFYLFFAGRLGHHAAAVAECQTRTRCDVLLRSAHLKSSTKQTPKNFHFLTFPACDAHVPSFLRAALCSAVNCKKRNVPINYFARVVIYIFLFGEKKKKIARRKVCASRVCYRVSDVSRNVDAVRTFALRRFAACV